MRVESVLKSYCILIGALIAVGYPIYLLSSQGLIDPTGEILIGRDFANYYNASQLAVTGELNRLFDIVEYRAYLNQTFGQRFELNWSYPPHFLFFALPLAGLPYLVAYGVWVCAGLGIYIGAAWRSAIERYHLRRSQVAVLLLAPATLINAFFGQNGFITGTLLYLGVRYTAQRPVLAGICFGILTIKPQLGLLIPVMLVLTRQWLTIAVAIATAMTLIAASGAAFGMQSWVDYFEKVLPYQRGVMEEGTGLFLQMMPSVYGLGRLIGLSPRFMHADPAAGLVVRRWSHHLVVRKTARPSRCVGTALLALYVHGDPLCFQL